MNIISSADAGRGSTRSSFRRKLLTGALLGLMVVAALFVASGSLRSASGAGAGPASAATGNPLGQLARSPIDDAPITGRVEERLAAGSYTYLAVRSDKDALVWAVTLGDGAPAGAPVKVRSMGRRTNFYSRRLGRTFDELVFGIVSASE